MAFRPPYTQTYTFALQHQFGNAAVGEIRYTGSLTERNFQSNNANPYLLAIQQAFLAQNITFGTTAYNATGSIPSPTGFISGNRLAILGAKVVF
jgi:hypothetical protein